MKPCSAAAGSGMVTVPSGLRGSEEYGLGLRSAFRLRG